MTSEGDDAQDFRVIVEPAARNGLRTRSHVMADKPVTIRRERVGRKIGHLDDGDIARLNVALAFVMGLADSRVTRGAFGISVASCQAAAA
ncbi:MAG TPA: type II toxin-antitoxin system PemK/MazF family toxin [Steroidobacteraceae bacterium]|nr:type II toxin-antitoxin system PemK/MazF family toxin [Steroidobacteraceae bacterium]